MLPPPIAGVDDLPRAADLKASDVPVMVACWKFCGVPRILFHSPHQRTDEEEHLSEVAAAISFMLDGITMIHGPEQLERVLRAALIGHCADAVTTQAVKRATIALGPPPADND